MDAKHNGASGSRRYAVRMKVLLQIGAATVVVIGGLCVGAALSVFIDWLTSKKG